MKEWWLIQNPGARAGRRVADALRSGEIEPPGDVTLCWVDIGELAERHGSPDRVIAIGGDGTVNATATWLVERDVDCPLAIVPAGTGNNLARGLGLSLDREQAVQVACSSTTTRSLDGIEATPAGGRSMLLLQSGALGFPAEVAASYDRLRERKWFRALARPLGTYVYRLLSLGHLARQASRQRRRDAVLRVTGRIGDEALAEEVFAIFIGNERSLGGNFVPCPRAVMDDGRVDLCLVRPLPVTRYPGLFRRVVKGHHVEGNEAVSYHQTRGPVELEFSEEIALLLDGDLPVTARRFVLRVLPRRFSIVVPASSTSPPGEPKPSGAEA